MIPDPPSSFRVLLLPAARAFRVRVSFRGNSLDVLLRTPLGASTLDRGPVSLARAAECGSSVVVPRETESGHTQHTVQTIMRHQPPSTRVGWSMDIP